jgi:hypothetical protein
MAHSGISGEKLEVVCLILISAIAFAQAADGKWIDHPDLSKVDEIGFTDLMAGSGHGPGGWSDAGRVEVYGKPVKRL